MITRCEYPQWIHVKGLEHQKLVPCGKCFTCRRKNARRAAGQTMMEQAYPLYSSHGLPKSQHFFALTYREERLPMTTPKPHNLGFVEDASGDDNPFNGPFVKDPDRYALEGKEIHTHDGLAKWSDTDEYLSEDELAEEHFRYLQTKLGWSENDVKRWEDGDYDPEPTTSVKDMQKYVDRLRKWHSRHREPEEPLRYKVCTEYGGVTQRPHAHIILFGLRQDDIQVAYDYWEEHSGGNGLCKPYLSDAILEDATVMRDRAAVYQMKDMFKSRHLYVGTPAKYATEQPKQFGSKHPPLGDAAFEWWFESHILRLIEKSTKLFSGDQEKILHAIMKDYCLVHLPVNGRSETFTSTKRWRTKVRETLAIPDKQWEAARETLELQHNEVHHAIRNNILGLGDEFKQFTQSSIEARKRYQERDAEATKRKRSKLIATGRIRPVHGVRSNGISTCQP